MTLPKIVIIEDNLLVANLYANKFRVEGFEVTTAPDGEQGLSVITSFNPDIVLLDLVLPGVSGLEVLRQIRANPETARVPVVVFSSTHLSGMIKEAWAAGATKCLLKGTCTPRQAVDSVRSAIARQTGTEQTVLLSQKYRRKEAGPAKDTAPVARLPQSLSLFDRLTDLRARIPRLAKMAGQESASGALEDIIERLGGISAGSTSPEMSALAAMCNAIDRFLRELKDRTEDLSPGATRTLAAAVDFLSTLYRSPGLVSADDLDNAVALVVDDDTISRRAVTRALERTHIKAFGVQDPVATNEMLGNNRFDLVVLDIDMPGLNGFELCTQIRAKPEYKETPIVFVTSHDSFETRSASISRGANDLLTKPFLFSELGVKAVQLVLGSRMRSREAKSAAPEPAAK